MIAVGSLAQWLAAHRLAVVLFAALSVVHTWPLATDPATWSLNDNGDAQLNEWILAWIVHQLPRDPANLFNANIFHPARGSLAFSEPLIVPAILGAPVFWLGGSPVLAYNLLVLLGFTLTGLATYALVFSWTRDRPAALVAGAIFAFNTHTLTRLPHLQAIHAYGLPLALLFTDRLIREPRAGIACGLGITMAVMACTSGYLVVFATIGIAVALIVRVREWRRRARPVVFAFALAAVVAGLLSLPVALPYRNVAVEHGMVRSLENVRQFSASLTGYLASTGRVHSGTWSAQFLRNPVDTFFPGVVAILLSAAAVWRASRFGVHASRVLMVSCIGLVGLVLSLGVKTPIYGWLFAVFPPMQSLRAAARFGNLFLLGIAILAGAGLAGLRGGLPEGWRRKTLAVAAVVLVSLEALRAPFEYRRFDGIPAIYELLAQEAGPVVLAEMPFYPAPAAFRNAEYVLNSTAHWRPLMNGYSGYTPASYRRVAPIFWAFPREHAIQAMRGAGVTHFTVHPDRFGARAQETIEALSGRTDVELLAIAAGAGTRLYRFR